MKNVQPVCVLSIAGSDSGGGAGIQADLRTFAALGAHGTTAVSATTAQNTLGVHDVVALPASHVRAQIAAVLDDFTIAAVKTGMLANEEIIGLVADMASQGRLPNLVVDPVLVSTSNHAMVTDGGARAYRELLLPHTFLLTPNLREAATLVGIDIADIATVATMIEVGETLRSLGATNVLMKGGHFAEEGPNAPDILISPNGTHLFDGARIDTTNDHGTGCSLSAAICTYLAQGATLSDACRHAKDFVAAALRGGSSWRLGRGRGPIDHLGWTP